MDLLLRHVRMINTLCYPEPGDVSKRALTVWTLFSQYGIPMSVTAAAYGHIVRVFWARSFVGVPNVNQRMCHQRARRRTIRMLTVVVLIFCGCWLPLQLYHVLTDWQPESGQFQPQSSVYLACYWLAVSSVCYNPIVYFGRLISLPDTHEAPVSKPFTSEQTYVWSHGQKWINDTKEEKWHGK